MKICHLLFLQFIIYTSFFFSQNQVSNKSGNWNDPTAWTPNGVPTAASDVTITNGNIIAINANAVCNSLHVGTGGSAATLRFSGNTARTLSVTNNIVVNTSATFNILTNSNTTHSVNVSGDVINNGTLDLAVDGTSRAYLICSRNGNQSISGSGTLTDFYKITLNMGTSINNILEINSSSFICTSNFLTLLNGTFKLSTPNAATLVPFTAAANIPVTSGLWINSPTAAVSASAAVNLSGMLQVSSGSVDIGNGNNEDLTSTGGTVIISGGSLEVAGKYNASSGTANNFSISGGIFTVPNVNATNTGIAPFNMTAAGSLFNMTGGTILLRREGGSGAQDLGFTNTGGTSGTVSGGTLQIGNSTTPTSQTININSVVPIPNLWVNSVNARAKLSVNSATVINNVTISSGSLIANNLNISVGGDWNNSGGFTPGTGAVNFDSSNPQSILKTGGETFNTLIFTGAGLKTFASAITATGNFSIASGAIVDVSASNFSLALRGNFTNNGTFITRSGLVTLNGTVAQTIGGSTITDFFDLTLNNAAGASLTNSENLIGSLTLSNGTFNTNSQVFTMVSTATATARIAQITGSGDITGNVTVQRFVPGGTTGWALLGNPLSSAITLAEWDDDIIITCPTCPDGYGGFNSIYTYNETLSGAYDAPNSYVPLNALSDVFVSGRGYWVYLGTSSSTTSPITLDMTGAVRKNGYSLPLNYTNTGSVANDGWNLITNPYPSPISWTALRGVTANLDNAVYSYNADLNAGTGGFATFVNGISSPAVGSGGIGDNIPMGQGFYVHSTGATAISALESNKVSANPTFLKSNSSQVSTTPLLRLHLTGVNTTSDETVLYFQNNATDSFDDGFDSYKLRGQDPLAPVIALEKSSEMFQVNGIAPINGNFTMPLKVSTGYSGSYTITSENIASFPHGACISLYDRFTSTTTDLKNSDYVFYLQDTTSVARFDLNITINSLGASSSIVQPTCVSPNTGKIKATGTNSGPWNYYWKLNGTPVKTTLNHAGPDSLLNLSSGQVELELNSVGLCDNNESSYFITEQIPVSAQFLSLDTLDLNTSASIQFTNTSVNSVTNYWEFGQGQGSSVLSSPAYNYSTPGSYLVKLTGTSSTGCTDTAYKMLSVILRDLVNIEDVKHPDESFLVKTIHSNEFVLYNEFTTSQTLSFKLFDSSGKLVEDFGSVTSTVIEFPINLNAFAKGIYFMKISSSEKHTTLKFAVN